MDAAGYLKHLAADGALLSRTATKDLSAPVPLCPGWDVRDAVRHTAEVYEHKMACIALGGARPDPWPPEWPADQDPIAWFDDAHRRLLETLRTTDPAAPSWTWWPDDQTAGFWVRRMAQETAVHRADVELAFGPPTPVDPELAVDGIDELLVLMLEGDWTGDEAPDLTGTMAVTTAGRTWTVTMTADRVVVEEGLAKGPEVTVSAQPSPLLLWLYGRAPDDVVGMSGDPRAAGRLRQRLALATQ
jgi:uncharacterized protein (TIGR03083 family)